MALPPKYVFNQIQLDARNNGCLVPIVTILCNCILDKYCSQTSPAERISIIEYLLEENFITGLLKHVAGYDWLESMKISFLSGLHSFVDSEYLRECPVALELKQSFQNNTTKAATKYFARRIVTTAKRHTKENLTCS